MKSTWSRKLLIAAALAGLPTWVSAADSWPVESNDHAAGAKLPRIVLPVGGQSGSGSSTERSSIGFVNTPSEPVTTPATHAGRSHAAATVYRRSAPKRSGEASRRVSRVEPRQLAQETVPQYAAIPLRVVKPSVSVNSAVPRLMTECSPAQLADRTESLTDDDGESQSLRRSRAIAATNSEVTSMSSRIATPSIRLRVTDESAALSLNGASERIPPVTQRDADAPRLLAATPDDQLATARPLSAGTRPETFGPTLRRAPLADRLAALQDRVPSSYVGIQGCVGAINLGDQTVKLNFDRRQPPPLGGVVKVYQAQAQETICVGALKIIRVYGGVATGAPVGHWEVERLMAGDLAVFHVGSDPSSHGEPDPNEVIWVSDRIRSARR